MRNGQNQELARANVAQAEDSTKFENLAVERPAPAAPPAQHHDADPEHLSSTSFSFELEAHSTLSAPAPQQNTEPQSRIERFPELATDFGAADLSPQQQRALAKESSKAQSVQAKKLRAASTVRSPRGASSLLDRYISFIARFMKMFEKFLMKLLRRQQGEPNSHNSSTKTERTQDGPIETRPQKSKRKIPLSGPRL